MPYNKLNGLKDQTWAKSLTFIRYIDKSIRSINYRGNVVCQSCCGEVSRVLVQSVATCEFARHKLLILSPLNSTSKEAKKQKKQCKKLDSTLFGAYPLRQTSVFLVAEVIGVELAVVVFVVVVVVSSVVVVVDSSVGSG